MPYRRKGRCVQVKKHGRWQTIKCHKTTRKAVRHLTALRINVGHGRKRR